MQGTPCTAREVGPVQEDARAVDDTGHRAPVVGRRQKPTALGLLGELPLIGAQPHHCAHDGLHVVVIDEMCPVTAAPLLEVGGVVVEHAFASGAEDARPVRPQERGIGHPGAVLVVVFVADPLVYVEWLAGFGGSAAGGGHGRTG